MAFTVTIVFDNNSLLPGFKTGWGFACVIETDDEKILYDTGSDGKILLDNLSGLHISPQPFSKLIISHLHWDHVGGIPEFLHPSPQCTVYLVASALADDVHIISSLCRDVQLVREPIEIARNVYSSGELPGYAWEQSLILKANDGLLVITGCAHHGIVNIISKISVQFPGLPVKLLLGGFHLHQTNPADIINVCNQLREAGVEKIAPAHCTGAHAIAICRDIFGKNFLPAGVGFQFYFS